MRTAAILVLLVSAFQVGAAPAANLWPRWEEHDSSSRLVIDHGRFQSFLDAYVDASHISGISRVAYGRVSQSHRKQLEDYLDILQNTQITRYNRREQFAYWVNLYNAFTIFLILDRYPVNSIRDISPFIFRTGPWGMRLITVEGEKLSLDDIEHRILRPIWRDNRIHYAVNCASLGCPNLQPVPFTAENAEALLDRGAREYFFRKPAFKHDRHSGSGLSHLRIVRWRLADAQKP